MEKLLKHHEKPSIDGPGQVAPAGFVDVFFFAENMNNCVDFPFKPNPFEIQISTCDQCPRASAWLSRTLR